MTAFSTTDSQISQGLVRPMAPQVARLLPPQAVTATEFFPALGVTQKWQPSKTTSVYVAAVLPSMEYVASRTQRDL